MSGAKANKHDALRLVKIWHDPLTDSGRREWLALTGSTDITTVVLWAYIKAAIRNDEGERGGANG